MSMAVWASTCACRSPRGPVPFYRNAAKHRKSVSVRSTTDTNPGPAVGIQLAGALTSASRAAVNASLPARQVWSRSDPSTNRRSISRISVPWAKDHSA